MPGASTVAADDNKFSEWLEGTTIAEPLQGHPANQVFLVDLADSRLLPTWFLDIKSPDYIHPESGLHEDFLAELCGVDAQGAKDTIYNATLLDSLVTIQSVWEKLHHLSDQQTLYNPREADWCQPMHHLVDHVLGQGKNDPQDRSVYREAQLHLVKSTMKAILTAVADIVVVLTLRNHVPRLGLKHHLESACLSDASSSALHLLHFAFESKHLTTRASGRNQLIFDLGSGLFQKQVLGLHNQFLFGCYTEGAAVWACVATWEDGKPIVYRLNSFQPLTISGLLQFFLFLQLAASKIPSYYQELSNIQSKSVEDNISRWGPWQACRGRRGRRGQRGQRGQSDEPGGSGGYKQGDSNDDGGPDADAGGPSGSGRRLQHRRGGRGRRGSRLPPPSSRQLRRGDALPPGMDVDNDDEVWAQAMSEWMVDSAKAIHEYGEPSPLTQKSVEMLPSTPNPYLGFKGGEMEEPSVPKS